MKQIRKILFITLSNIGDAILTLPVLDTLKQSYPTAVLYVMVAERSKSVFDNNPAINKLIIYNKRSPVKEKIQLFNELSRERFDLVVDLRNSFFGAFLPARYRTSPLTVIPPEIKHMRDRQLYRVKKILGHQVTKSPSHQDSIDIKKEDREYIDKILKENDIKDGDKIIAIAAGARSHVKRWPQERFVELIALLKKEFNVKIVLVGDNEDAIINQYIVEHCKDSVLDLSDRTSIAQLAYLLKKSMLLVANDSAVLHIASYVNIPIAAIFGPTNELKYGPWSDKSAVVKKEIFCRPCEKAQCDYGTLECMMLVKPADVLRAVRNILGISSAPRPVSGINGAGKEYERILIVRTDRIGDVLLSTPVIKALRHAYPFSYISAMVGPYAKDIVEGNPDLDEVIIYDKDGMHKSWGESIKFAGYLKLKDFDLAVVLHPTNRAHLITFLAGISKRLGYNRKMGFLLTDRIKHTKQEGQKHELEYNLDLVKALGIQPLDQGLFMPIRDESEKWAVEILKKESVNSNDKLLAIHPAASCPSKIWPPDRFAVVADILAKKYGFKVLLIAGPRDIRLAENVKAGMHSPVINLAGKTSVSQLASILKRCNLFISNDSGPVHIATAVGTPVISIFGRNQKGLSPKRWGPVGKKDKFLHKEVGCSECLAHDCEKGFACLKAITVDDVVQAADAILKSL